MTTQSAKQPAKTATVPPVTENTPPKRIKNKDKRPREYLTPDEVERLYTVARVSGPLRVRNVVLLDLLYRHALRAAEAVTLRWDAIDRVGRVIHINRVKNGVQSVHPLKPDELARLTKLWKFQRRAYLGPAGDPEYVIMHLYHGPVTTRTIHHTIQRLGERAGLPWPIHPHMLRHACGYYLANHGADTRAIQVYMGHADIKNTTLYTELNPDRFQLFFK